MRKRALPGKKRSLGSFHVFEYRILQNYFALGRANLTSMLVWMLGMMTMKTREEDFLDSSGGRNPIPAL
jgi:hypothetical protein